MLPDHPLLLTIVAGSWSLLFLQVSTTSLLSDIVFHMDNSSHVQASQCLDLPLFNNLHITSAPFFLSYLRNRHSQGTSFSLLRKPISPLEGNTAPIENTHLNQSIASGCEYHLLYLPTFFHLLSALFVTQATITSQSDVCKEPPQAEGIQPVPLSILLTEPRIISYFLSLRPSVYSHSGFQLSLG